uniref:Uncharacterized protein n=1 Tax=Arundo donax TaxID=35708 RepID=A0A0A9AA13_ARUDO
MHSLHVILDLCMELRSSLFADC